MKEQGSDFSTGGQTNLCAGVVREGERNREKEKKERGRAKEESNWGKLLLSLVKTFQTNFLGSAAGFVLFAHGRLE